MFSTTSGVNDMRARTKQYLPRLSMAAAGAAGLLALAGCAVNNNIGACPTAPPLVSEVMPKPPVSEQALIWQPGHWDWNGATYAWTAGGWIPRGSISGQWLDGHWERQTVPAACAWVPAHWL
jgi:hypothetical protein